MVNGGTLKSTADFASALSDAISVKIYDLFAFLVMPFFSSFVHSQKSFAAKTYTSRKLQDYKNNQEEDYFLIT